MHKNMCAPELKMIQITRSLTFGASLRIYRGKSYNEYHRHGLSQEKIATLVSARTGYLINRNKVGEWERGEKTIHQDDRDMLLALIAVFLEFGGLKTLEEANRLLELGNYRKLNHDEIGSVNPPWNEGSDSNSKEPTPPEDSPDESPPEIKPPNLAPHPPRLIVGREETHRVMKARLGLTPSGGISEEHRAFSAIQGWPGLGKTTTATVIAHDPRTLEKYPHGVLWVTLGQNPKILPVLIAWGRALGMDGMTLPHTLEEATRQLTAFLRKKRVLLIVDDVWKTEHAILFKLGGPKCAMIITTRINQVAQKLAPLPDDVYKMKILPDDEAFELLQKLAPEIVEQHPEESLKLVQELEGLPLAIRVAGHLLNVEASYGFSVDELIAELHEGVKLLEAKAPPDRFDISREVIPTVAALLQHSTDRLDPEIRTRFAYLGAFESKPATFDLEALKAVWMVEDPKPTVRVLVDRGLLEPTTTAGRFQIHALLVMLARTMLKKEETAG